jgi:hypothetical protein
LSPADRSNATAVPPASSGDARVTPPTFLPPFGREPQAPPLHPVLARAKDALLMAQVGARAAPDAWRACVCVCVCVCVWRRSERELLLHPSLMRALFHRPAGCDAHPRTGFGRVFPPALAAASLVPHPARFHHPHTPARAPAGSLPVSVAVCAAAVVGPGGRPARQLPGRRAALPLSHAAGASVRWHVLRSA